MYTAIFSNVCYIYGAGEHFVPPPVPLPCDYVIAADGGLAYLKKHGVIPNLVVGDFDSGEAPSSGIETVILPREKDNTDMAEAIRIGFEKGFREFHIYGGTGGRIEHTLANIQCLAALAAVGARGFLFDRDNTITAIRNGVIYFNQYAEGYISVFAHSDTAEGVCLKGLKYPLDDATLLNAAPIGVSNEFIGEPSSVSVRDGTVIVVF